MQAALDTIDQGISGLADADVTAISSTELCQAIVAAQRLLDRLRVVQARLIHEAQVAGAWIGTGHRSMEAWLAAQGKITLGDARRQSQLGEALNASKHLSDAVDSGRISVGVAEALTPAATAANDCNASELIAACAGASPLEARKVSEVWVEMNRPIEQTEAEREHAKRQRRYLTFARTGDGLVKVDGLLTPLDARTVRDALSHLAGRPVAGDDRTPEQRSADALAMLADAYSKGEVKGGRQRPTVIVGIDVDVLEARKPGVGYTSKGDIIPAEIVRHMCDNANLVRVLTSKSMPLDVGRSKRFATDDQFRALIARDGGCRMRDCPIPPDWCEVDHIREWEADVGETDLDWLVMWCHFHHHFRHRPDVRLFGDANNLSIQMPSGEIIALPARGFMGAA
jgi:Domain of unknown function (DUF222)